MARRRRPEPSSQPPSRSDLWGSLYPTLDLHGLTAEEAVRRAREWLRARRSDGERTVRLITGRGLHSVGPPVLPEAVDDLLRGLRGVEVASHEREPGGGVVRVTLRPPDSTPMRPNTPARHDPEVERLARESLAELGVDPTPAVLAAEVQRILDERNRR